MLLQGVGCLLSHSFLCIPVLSLAWLGSTTELMWLTKSLEEYSLARVELVFSGFSELNWPTMGKRSAWKEGESCAAGDRRKRGREGETRETSFFT